MPRTSSARSSPTEPHRPAHPTRPRDRTSGTQHRVPRATTQGGTQMKARRIGAVAAAATWRSRSPRAAPAPAARRTARQAATRSRSASSSTSPASASRRAPSTPAWTSTSPSTSPRSSAPPRTRSPGCRRPAPSARPSSRPVRSTFIVATYSITDARKEKVGFAGPYFVAGQDLLVRADDTSITGPGQPQRQEALLGQGLDVRPEGQGQVRPDGPAPGVRRRTPSACPPSPPAASTL